MTKIVFMGTPEFSVPILEGLVTAGYDVAAVVTQPDRAVGRKKKIIASPVKNKALELGISVLQPEKISGSQELEEIDQIRPDLIVTAAFGQFLPEKLLQIPTYGALNVHASLLPKYRGGAPVHYAIINGENETGVSIMEMVKKMDAGSVYAQESVPIMHEDDVGTMFTKLSYVGRDLLLKVLPQILSGSLFSVEQDEQQVTFAPNIRPEEEVIDWRQTAQEIDQKVRGMRPWPIAYTTYQGNRWKIWSVSVLTERTEANPGTIIRATKGQLWVACGNQSILAIEELQPSGKNKQKITDFLNGMGQKVAVGEQVGQDEE
ncbi:methionyl-tRNA formyltransferase [Tetragenococcus muriaticus PMC-11-5]|uniref:Methionyl-tRNA formyltransferase n=1 Tax=Tetragenococcus muriaticus PMC-11-5 TaxID=1302649 RepID=A0A091C9H3_9ENTE|nr:methionyl-tRNA formyltransferase [Tetragenococcus muriaticus]KFN93749.1 methionyl-tRNA formyltransferase [Tetragenococcus muriaticus PMC-11-5]GMA48266.1 methionyl-tRNA formyltransferase [Tetragenococcus muriaticus]